MNLYLFRFSLFMQSEFYHYSLNEHKKPKRRLKNRHII